MHLQRQFNEFQRKCFGIKKNEKQSTQFKPYLKKNNEMILAAKLRDLFVYLGK